MILVQECGAELLSCFMNLVLVATKRVKEPRGRAHPSSFLTPPSLTPRLS